ncbi:uncharacterized protein K452DRAFT_38772 [Aplosporella prunicola CBS 121167]|uniref:Uncharacterized protein n=1 Tax=Aplosporella prunicola CBS 121167 TaxID=1176127 RepID=A0A6A6BDL8_9PEZI|nr:uncharacterized protein K452DRAFT_38772 [Aplosporella prunicola CBS 121167]KAF2141385.1 hypothetical protein K452DRAFT_38772 [Aplosporella prunicola CBS 121167]
MCFSANHGLDPLFSSLSLSLSRVSLALPALRSTSTLLSLSFSLLLIPFSSTTRLPPPTTTHDHDHYHSAAVVVPPILRLRCAASHASESPVSTHARTPTTTMDSRPSQGRPFQSSASQSSHPAAYPQYGPPTASQPPVHVPFSDPFQHRDPFLPSAQQRRGSYGLQGGTERGWGNSSGAAR